MKRNVSVTLSMVVAVFVSLCLAAPCFAAAKDEPKKDAAKKESPKAVDLNNASQKELEALKGVGAAKAKKIIANRPYKSADELSKAGLSKKEIDGLKSQVVVGAAPAAAPKSDAKAQPAAKMPEKAAPTAKEEKPAKEAKKEKDAKKEAKAKLAPGQKINLNTASQSDLELLPEIGPAKAKAIIAGRPYSKPEDIMNVKGIKQKTYDQIKDNIVVK